MTTSSPRVTGLGLAVILCFASAPALGHPGIHDDIALADRRLAASPDASGFLARAELHRIAGEHEEAALDLARASALDSGLEALPLCRAALAADRGRLDEASAALEEYLAQHPDDGRALVLRARVASGAGRPLEAARDLGLALVRIASPSPDLFAERSRLLASAGPEHMDEALATLDLGIARLGPIPSLGLAAVDLEETRGHLDAALDRLDGLAADLEQPGVWLARRARLLERMGDADGALWSEAAAEAARDRIPEWSEQTLTIDAARALGGIAPHIPERANPPGIALAVTRAPYLLMGTHDRITVRWRTDEATNSRVSHGTSLASLDATADDPTLTTEHEITLTGLSPDTRYYYSVGTDALPLAGGDSDHTFVTAPLPGTPKPTRIWTIGDSGTGSFNAVAVRDAFVTYGAQKPADLWLMLGDNAYSAGTDAEYQAAVFNMYPAMLRSTVLWPTRGNHDVLYSGDNNDYYDIFTLPTAAEAGGLPSGTEAYYSFDYANIHFICLDSEGSDRSVGGPMATWLRADLAATPRDWVIAFWHHPPYTKGSHNSDNDADSGGRMRDMRQNFLPILDSTGVDLVLVGHSHSYERSFLLNGHYGPSSTLTEQMKVNAGDGQWDGNGPYGKATLGTGPNEGCVYTVAGSSGQISGGTLNHPVMVRSLNVLGSVVIDVDGPRLDARFLDSQGAVRDSFTVLKPPLAGVHSPPGRGLPGLRILSANPSRGAVRFGYRLESAQRPRLVILDAVGRRVRVAGAGSLGAGEHEAVWDGRDDRGQACPAGVYFAVLEAGSRAWGRKVIRLGP